MHHGTRIMPRNALIIVGGLLLAACLIAWLWLQPQSPPTAASSGAGSSDARAADEAPPNTGAAPPRSEQPPDRAEVSLNTPQPFSALRLGVRVVRSGSGAPAAGSTVYWLSSLDAISHGASTSVLERARRDGNEARTDRDGRVEIDYSGNVFRACAVTEDGWFGTVSTEAGYRRSAAAGDVVLTVAPELDLDLIVRGPSGAPVPGAGIQLCDSRSRIPVFRGRADDDGRMRIAHLQTLVRGDAARVLAVAWGGAGPVVEVRLAEIANRTEPVELRLPASGELLVAVGPDDARSVGVDIEGRRLSVGNLELSGSRDGVQVLDPVAGPGERFDANGVARIRPVALGGRFALSAGFGGLSARVDGPSAAGQVRRVELTVPWTTRAMARCRVVRPGGSPVGAVHGLVRVLANGEVIDTLAGAEFDANGCRIWPLPPAASGDVRIHVRVNVDGVPMQGESASRPCIDAGQLDLGDVQVAPMPLLVSGKVVDQAGRPFPDRVVLAPRVRRQGPSKEPVSSNDWERIAAQYRWRKDGTFAFYGEAPPPGELRLETIPPLMVVGDSFGGHPFVVGQTDARVVLAFAGGIKARLRVDESCPWSSCAFSLHQAGEPASALGRPGTPSQSGDMAAQGEIEVVWEGLPPGGYELRVRGSQLAPLFVARGLEVVAGGTSTTEASQPIGLADVVGGLTVEFVGRDGSVRPTALATRQAGSDSEWVWVTDPSSRLPIASGLDVRAAFAGYEPVELVGITRDRRVILQDPLPVRIEVGALPAALQEPSIRLRVRSTPAVLAIGAYQTRGAFSPTSARHEIGGNVDRLLEVGVTTPALVPLPLGGLPWSVEPADPQRWVVTPARYDRAPDRGVWHLEVRAR